jgi:hypothetical protein
MPTMNVEVRQTRTWRFESCHGYFIPHSLCWWRNSARSYIEGGDNDVIEACDRSSIGAILDVCHGLVTFDIATGVFRFPHLTIQEFLGGYGRLCSICEIAKVCITYLSFDVFGEGPYDSRVYLKTRLEKYRTAKYVAQCWPDCVKRSENLRDTGSGYVVPPVRRQTEFDGGNGGIGPRSFRIWTSNDVCT